MPRFTFEKFPGADPILTTSMKSVGEAMAIGRCFAESLQKALRSMETGLTGLNEVDIPGALDADGRVDRDAVRTALAAPRPDRLLTIAQAFRHGLTLVEILERSEEHTSELQSLMRISYAVFCLKKKTHIEPQT